MPLHDVICEYCNAVLDVDVARDFRLWSSGNEDDTNGEQQQRGRRQPELTCEYCGDVYDLRQIELDLVLNTENILLVSSARFDMWEVSPGEKRSYFDILWVLWGTFSTNPEKRGSSQQVLGSKKCSGVSQVRIAWRDCRVDARFNV